MRKEDDDGQKKRIIVLLSAVLQYRERKGDIYNTTQIDSIRQRDESNPIPWRSSSSSFHSHLFTSS